MAGNSIPIWTRVGNVSANAGTTMGVHIITATGDYTGVSANHALVWTADATNGGLIQRLHFCAEGSNTASVARIYINNGSDPTTAANNKLFGQLGLPTITGTNTAATAEPSYPLNFALDPGFRIYVGLGTSVASGWMVTAIGGKY